MTVQHFNSQQNHGSVEGPVPIAWGRALSQCIVGIGIGLLILMFARACFIYSFSLSAIMQASTSEITRFILDAILIDIKSVFTLLIPVVILEALSLIHPFSSKILRRPIVVLVFVIHLWLLITAIINFYFFKTYDQVTGPVLFTFAAENPKAVLHTIVNDYPVVTVSIGLIIFAPLALWAQLFLVRLLTPLFTAIVPRSLIARTNFCAILVALFLLGLQSSVTSYKRPEASFQMGSESLIRASVSNGSAAIKNAWTWYVESHVVRDISPAEITADLKDMGLMPNGFSLENNSSKHPSLPKHQIPYEAFITKTAPFTPGFKLPDISISLLEGMSTHILSYDSPDLNLLGSLRTESEQSGTYIFNNFLSGGNGTADSIIRLLLSVPDNSIADGPHARGKFLFNSLLPFKKLGYKIIYVTGDAGTWHNLKNFLLAQGVDEVADQETILKRHPEATVGTWGADDEFIYITALDLFREQKQHAPKQPVLIITQSVTNHQPYDLPHGAPRHGLKLTSEIAERFPYENTSGVFYTIRYAADMFAAYVEALKSEPLANGNIIISATGDHNVRGISYTSHPEETLLGHMVPFFLYLPAELRPDDRAFSISHKLRYGSHKDIIPTILGRLKSGLKYYTTGCDLFANPCDCKTPAAFNSELAVTGPNQNYVCLFSGDKSQIKVASILPGSIKIAPTNSIDNAFECSQAQAYMRFLTNMNSYGLRHQEEISMALQAIYE